MTGTQTTPPFRLAYVPGVTPAKWTRTWAERLPDVPLDLLVLSAAEAVDALHGAAADAALVRLPIDRTGLSAIPLYTETSVVVVPKDHEVSAVDEVSVTDLADYVVLHPLDDSLGWENPPGLPAVERPATVADAIELVAAGVGLLVVPQSLARLHHRRDLTYRPLTDADVPQSSVALAWLEAQTTDLVEEFIGIVRGRTVNSSRGRAATPPPAAAAAAKSPVNAKSKPPQGQGQAKAKAKQQRNGSGKTQGAKPGKPRRRP
ncbi:MAG TPA: LysR substrate-binding domain-containing protein [Actinocrinis sp.]|nr:LysR substrate-binding domain-containing protein [Actinocrinis sp.]